MTRPQNWPFATWLDLDEVAEQNNEIASLVVLQRDYLDFVHSFLHGTEVFVRPAYFQNVLHGLTEDLYLGAVSSGTYNPAGYAIGIYAGAWLQLLFCFQRLLAPPEVFAECSTIAEVGDAKAHGCKISLGLPLLTPGGPKTLFHPNANAPPLDDGKAVLIRELTALGCRFLFLHEFVHIHGYHVDYLLSRAVPGGAPAFERQGLEHLADMGAAIWAAHFAVLTGMIKADQKNISKRKAIAAQLKLQGFAAGVISLLLEALNPYAQSDYPAASWRALLIRVGPSGSPAEFPSPLSRREVLDAIATGFEHALEAWDILGWDRKELSRSSLIPSTVDDYVSKVMAIEKCLAVPELRAAAASTGRRPAEAKAGVP